MLFASNIFLFLFLPIVLVIYYVFMRTRSMKNIFLLIVSLLFYGYGEPKFVFIILISIFVNYIVGLLIELFRKKKYHKISTLILVIGIIYNILILTYYKYWMFIIENLNSLFHVKFDVGNILLPIGISFFTFQILSYIIDVYRGKVFVQKNIFNLGLYISLFPQLIAGPIVRYETVQDQILHRKENIDIFAIGIEKFIKGLGKKVIISNTMALIADYVFSGPVTVSSFSLVLVWLGAVAYAFQIFYDFSGYSDMAIGLGKMFGFSFEENFNYPYISKSISEFWRRWHISLGTWFKDYVYIPLGGSECTKKRLIFNLFIVWFLTGLWHGASWNFIIWGLLNFVLIVFEKLFGFEKKFSKLKLLQHAYSIFFILIGWVIFRTVDLPSAFNYIKRMFVFKNIIDYKSIEFIIENLFIFIVAIVISTPIIDKLKIKFFNNNIVKLICLLLILLVSVSYIVKGVYNPFIYFNF